MTCKPLSIAEFSDVHLGHTNTLTAHILRVLRHMFPDTPETHNLDLILIPGDLFDRLLDYNSEEVTEIELWWIGFLRMCARHDIVLRVSRGTPLHDRDQIDRLFALIPGLEIPVDAAYYRDLSIERNERLGVDILYIPDEWRHRCDDTWVEVVDLLKQNGLDKVDIIAMHGAFHHQMPKNIHHALELHDANRYKSICRGVIYVGHVHQMSNLDNVLLAAGSTDRLCHGDEGTKGHWRSSRREDGSYTHRFIPNKLAQIYHSINVGDLTKDNLYPTIDKKIKDFPKGSHVRLVGKKNDLGLQAIDTLRNRHPFITWTVKELKADGQIETPMVIDTVPIAKTINITKDNVEELLKQRMQGKYSEILFNNASQLLKEAVNG